MNKAAESIWVSFPSCGVHLEREWLDHTVITCLTAAKLFHHFTFPPETHKGANFSTSLSTLFSFFCLYSCHPVGKKLHLMVVFICNSLTSEAEHLSCTMWPSGYLLGRNDFLNWVACLRFFWFCVFPEPVWGFPNSSISGIAFECHNFPDSSGFSLGPQRVYALSPPQISRFSHLRALVSCTSHSQWLLLCCLTSKLAKQTLVLVAAPRHENITQRSALLPAFWEREQGTGLHPPPPAFFT